MSDEAQAAPKPRVLVVDDSKVMRLAAAKVLGEAYDVVHANDGEDGWEMLSRDETIQVVFTDLSMPNLDGYGFLERVRGAEDPRLRDLAVIVITGDEDDERARERALAQGATDFITKPFNSVDLQARAKAHVSSAQTARKLAEQATIDSVTGLGNRRHFMEKLDQDRSYALRHARDLSLLRIDVDGFNELLLKAGPRTGEAILRKVAETIRSCIRNEDSAARLERSHFAVSLPSSSAAGARQLAERLRGEIEGATFTADQTSVTVPISAGIACLEDGDAEAMLDAAGRAVEAAGRQPGGGVVVYADLHGETGADSSAGAPPAQPPPVPEEAVPRLERALALLAQGEAEKVVPHLPALLSQLAPLLALAHAEHPEALRDALGGSGSSDG
ncbi:MAG: diguanylate cyclase [Gammaproteobacteria bacterium]|nr:diguanylate cyclase [Gammaproteobacteria bacterium]NIR98876.1 diguanylate cyclase [Gammaproteobacteria bacterium]NIT63997.1 diguanylate cyclase [Gammaproteobacteria bacterium]NIV19157.1 diguanylate cyclase [Gammaproteobacteria bacterium]NIX10326.1 diguanylate cyclase [Gammaproteobacteria bacterium]